jgi:hypothetical protein
MSKAELELNFDMWKDGFPAAGESVTLEIAYVPAGDGEEGHVSLALNHALKESGQVTRLWYPLNDAERRTLIGVLSSLPSTGTAASGA